MLEAFFVRFMKLKPDLARDKHVAASESKHINKHAYQIWIG
jgi:hypothetical protein